MIKIALSISSLACTSKEVQVRWRIFLPSHARLRMCYPSKIVIPNEMAYHSNRIQRNIYDYGPIPSSIMCVAWILTNFKLNLIAITSNFPFDFLFRKIFWQEIRRSFVKNKLEPPSVSAKTLFVLSFTPLIFCPSNCNCLA